MALLRYALFACLTVLGLYGLMISATSLLFERLHLSRQLDTGSLASDAFFGTAGDVAAVYNRNALSVDRPQIILVGASNFQRVLASELHVPGFAAANISVSGTGVAEIGSLVELAYEAVPAGTVGHNVFVIGVWYGQFSKPHGVVWQSLNQQLSGYGLYRVAADDSIERTIPASLLAPSLTAIRPLLVEKRLWSSLQSTGDSLARCAISGAPAPAGVDQLAQDAVVLNAAERQQQLVAERKATAGDINPATFALLGQIVERITRRGDRAIIADLPIPTWHSAAVPEFAAYQRAKVSGFAAALKLRGAGYLDLQSSLVDDDFYDSVHPKPAAAAKLSHLIGQAVVASVGAR